ncbi:hypothetical protein ACA910_008808 [Epithemia clementina (nom. ined.)]
MSFFDRDPFAAMSTSTTSPDQNDSTPLSSSGPVISNPKRFAANNRFQGLARMLNPTRTGSLPDDNEKAKMHSVLARSRNSSILGKQSKTFGRLETDCILMFEPLKSGFSDREQTTTTTTNETSNEFNIIIYEPRKQRNPSDMQSLSDLRSMSLPDMSGASPSRFNIVIYEPTKLKHSILNPATTMTTKATTTATTADNEPTVDIDERERTYSFLESFAQSLKNTEDKAKLFSFLEYFAAAPHTSTKQQDTLSTRQSTQTTFKENVLTTKEAPVSKATKKSEGESESSEDESASSVEATTILQQMMDSMVAAFKWDSDERTEDTAVDEEKGKEEKVKGKSTMASPAKLFKRNEAENRNSTQATLNERQTLLQDGNTSSPFSTSNGGGGSQFMLQGAQEIQRLAEALKGGDDEVSVDTRETEDSYSASDENSVVSEINNRKSTRLEKTSSFSTVRRLIHYGKRDNSRAATPGSETAITTAATARMLRRKSNRFNKCRGNSDNASTGDATAFSDALLFDACYTGAEMFGCSRFVSEDLDLQGVDDMSQETALNVRFFQEAIAASVKGKLH